MRQNFSQIMSWLAVYEGGYVNHPRDPGGATNRGVTQRVYDAFLVARGLPTRSVRMLNDTQHDAIYFQQYWTPVQGDRLPSGVDASVFDMAVHSGVSRAARTLQRALGVKADGIIGEITLSRLKSIEASGGIADLLVDYNMRRMAFLRRLKTFDVFGEGWTRRVVGENAGVQDGDIGVMDRSVMLARNPKRFVAPPKEAVPGRASSSDLRWIARVIEALTEFVERLFQNQRGVA